MIAAFMLGLAPPTVQERLAQVSSAELQGTVLTLSAFGTRHTLSDTNSDTRGIGAARRWLKTKFESFETADGPLRAEFESLRVPPSVRVPTGADVVNVIGILEGTDPVASKRVYYVVGHYDSRNGDAMDAAGDAPGANDDASGTAVVVEIARVLAGSPLESSVVFLCTAGEEQGLLGAKGHAENKSVDKEWRICGVLSNDIVGDPWGETPRVAGGTPDPARVVRIFSEGIPRTTNPEVLARLRTLAAESDSPSRQIARYIADVACRERTSVQPLIVFRPDRFLRGGDHSAFNEAGFAAVRFTAMHEDYSRQHVNVTVRDGKPYGDVPEFVDAEYLAGVTRLNLAALVHMANAPSVPANARILTAKLETGTTVRWERSPEADTAGYEVVWRDTTSWQWDHSKDVGDVTEATMPMSKDNVFFGVRAYDKDGYRSPVAFVVDARQ